MAEFGQIPLRLNGSPIPAAGDVSVQEMRTVNQKPTTDGVKITYGIPKYQATVSFPTLEDRIAFMQAVGAGQLKPPTHNLGYDLAGHSFSLLRGIPSQQTVGSDQDGSLSLQYTLMYEEYSYDGPALA